MTIKHGTFIDANMIAEPSSAMNNAGKDDPVTFRKDVAGRRLEVDAFYWTGMAPDIVNPGRE